MESFTNRVKASGLPLDEVVVIGSGLLDAYGLRASRDIDLVVSGNLFKTLEQNPSYQKQFPRENTEVLIKGEFEIWLDWPPADFLQLKKDAVNVDGVFFVNPQFLIERKRERGSAKDLADITLLEGYLNEQ
jgi:hypothetical protein